MNQTRLFFVIVLMFFACQPVFAQGVKMEKLLETSQSWDGKRLPAYPSTQPKITVLKAVIAPGAKLAVHSHPVINCAVILQGTLKVVKTDGQERAISAGEAIAEVVGDWHYGINEGNVPVELIIFYAGDEKSPLSVSQQEDGKRNERLPESGRGTVH